MCAIFGSFNRDKFFELAELNSYRGKHSFSVSTFDKETGRMKTCYKQFGLFNTNAVPDDDVYYVGHIQAPTTVSKDTTSIHPSVYNNKYLWHNGILKADCISDMQEVFLAYKAAGHMHLGDHNEDWDTALLNMWIDQDRLLDDIDGTFSCLRYADGKITLFRNEISPMFVDGELNISSTKFDGSVKTKPNTVLEMKLDSNELVEMYSFQTKDNPYYWMEGI